MDRVGPAHHLKTAKIGGAGILLQTQAGKPAPQKLKTKNSKLET
jgi:hypothetical protein